MLLAKTSRRWSHAAGKSQRRGMGMWIGCRCRQDGIEADLARRRLREGGIVMFDLSTWVEGTHCELLSAASLRMAKARSGWSTGSSPSPTDAPCRSGS